MSFLDSLRDTAHRNQSILCLGFDPELDRIPLDIDDNQNKITTFCTKILEAVSGSIGAVKPNYAFFAQYGFAGLYALRDVILRAKEYQLPVILDGKRADIGKTSEAYGRETFDFWKADAITISPYMGADSIAPFTKYCPDKGVYVLVRTSNPGASDLQEQMIDGERLFMKAASKVTGDWHKSGIGAVVGATAIEELGSLSKFFKDSGKEIPLLIPGIGSQGGTAKEVISTLRNTYDDLSLHRINSSSGILYAHEKTKGDYVEAAKKAVEKLNGEIGFKR